MGGVWYGVGCREHFAKSMFSEIQGGSYGVLQGCGLIMLLVFLNAILQELAFTFANLAKSVL